MALNYFLPCLRESSQAALSSGKRDILLSSHLSISLSLHRTIRFFPLRAIFRSGLADWRLNFNGSYWVVEIVIEPAGCPGALFQLPYWSSWYGGRISCPGIPAGVTVRGSFSKSDRPRASCGFLCKLLEWKCILLLQLEAANLPSPSLELESNCLEWKKERKLGQKLVSADCKRVFIFSNSAHQRSTTKLVVLLLLS